MDTQIGAWPANILPEPTRGAGVVEGLKQQAVMQQHLHDRGWDRTFFIFLMPKLERALGLWCDGSVSVHALL